MTVPVPLTDIIGCSDADTRDRGVAEWRREHGRNVLAVCEALRIAVEGLDRVERWYVCKNVPDDDGDFITCRGFTDDSTGWCGWCCALDAIESVRELVDLGGDDG